MNAKRTRILQELAPTMYSLLANEVLDFVTECCDANEDDLQAWALHASLSKLFEKVEGVEAMRLADVAAIKNEEERDILLQGLLRYRDSMDAGQDAVHREKVANMICLFRTVRDMPDEEVE